MSGTTLQQTELPDLDTSWALLERVAASSQLRRAARLRQMLLYVGRCSLKDGCTQVREQEIGIHVFGRADSYDTSVDNIVRTNFSDLRKRIEAYFQSEGLHEEIVMEIPRGSYIPVFHYRPLAPPPESVSGHALPAAGLSQPGSGVASLLNRHRWTASSFLILALAIVCGVLSIASATLWVRDRAAQRLLYPWRYDPTVEVFWSGFLDSHQSTDVVMPDTSFRLLQALGKESFTLQDYLNRSYLNKLQAQQFSPEMHAILDMLSSRELGTQGGLRLAQRILSLDPSGQKLHMYQARDYSPALLKQDNVILVGSRFGNPWNELFDARLNFTAQDDFETPAAPASIVNRAPHAGEQPAYSSTPAVDYCTVAYLPNPQGHGNVLLIGGLGPGSLQAAGDFLLSETQLSSFQQMLHVQKLPYFEVLLKVPVVRGTPLAATIQAYRTYPDLH